jgi:hypothetical protein
MADAVTFRAEDWLRQPQITVGINRNHPLARGLVVAQTALPGLFEAVRGTLSTGNNVGSSAGPYGRQLDFLRASSSGVVTKAAGSWADRFSGFVIVRQTDLNVSFNEAFLSCRTAGNLGWSWGQGFAFGSPPNRQMRLTMTHQGVADYPSAVNIAGVDNEYVSFGFTDVVSSTVRLFARGAFIDSLAVGAMTSPGSQAVDVGATGPGASGKFFNGNLVLALLWDNRALTDAEHAELARNPWQLFAPEEEPVFYSLPSTTTYGEYISAEEWTRQPQIPVGINRAHPYGGKVAYANLLGPVVADAVRGGRGVTAGTFTYGVNRQGRALDFDGSGNYATTTLTAHATRRTYLAIVQRDGDGGGNFGRIFDKLTVGSQVDILLNDSSNNGYQYFRAFSSANGSWTFPRGSVGDVHIVGVTFDASSDSNDPRAWVNGVEQTVTQQTPPVGTASTNTDPYVIGNRGSDFGRSWDGRISTFVVIDDIVDPTTMSALTRNPFELFAPEETPVFYSIAGGGGGTTYDSSFSDAVSPTDLFAASQAFTSSVSDSVAAADVMSAAVSLLSSVTEAVTAGDALSALATFGAVLAEAVGPTDIVAAAVAFNSAVSEAVSALDSASGSQVFSSSFSEAVAATDAETGSQAQASSMSDAVSMADTMSATAVFAAQLSEAVLTLDSASARAEFVAALADSVDALDLPSSVVTMISAFSEAVSVVDQMDSSIPGGFKAYWARQNTFIGGGFVH